MYLFPRNVARVFRFDLSPGRTGYILDPVHLRWFFALLALPGCWSSAPPAERPVRVAAPVSPRAPDLRVPLSAEFGTVDDAGMLHPTAEIPLYPGSAFGWRIEIGCEHTTKVDEELQLPARGDWGADPDLRVSKNGRVARTQSETICLDGWVDKTWTVSANDPPGPWKVTVTVDGFRPQVFYATFVPAAAPPMSPLPQPMPGPIPPPTP